MGIAAVRESHRPHDYRLSFPARHQQVESHRASPFSHIAMNWRGTPLVNLATIMSLIGSTHSRSGLHVRSEIDRPLSGRRHRHRRADGDRPTRAASGTTQSCPRPSASVFKADARGAQFLCLTHCPRKLELKNLWSCPLSRSGWTARLGRVTATTTAVVDSRMIHRASPSAMASLAFGGITVANEPRAVRSPQRRVGSIRVLAGFAL